MNKYWLLCIVAYSASLQSSEVEIYKTIIATTTTITACIIAKDLYDNEKIAKNFRKKFEPQNNQETNETIQPLLSSQYPVMNEALKAKKLNYFNSNYSDSSDSSKSLYSFMAYMGCGVGTFLEWNAYRLPGTEGGLADYTQAGAWFLLGFIGSKLQRDSLQRVMKEVDELQPDRDIEQA